MTESFDFFMISKTLQRWYEQNKRDLPWRETKDPYAIWISEVILQQTRVNQGYDYYLRFIRRFPNVKALAKASEDDVLKQWQGLGYYSRARNLHAAAKQIEKIFHGEFPKKYADVRSLKGIGEYTAAAIMSIAYHAPFAVIDGNVLRVISRLFMIEEPVNSVQGKKKIEEIALAILDPQHPDIHNQAIMDFGATLCKPKQPKCTECPLQVYCLAFARNVALEYPVKNKSTKTTTRYFHYFHIIHRNHTYLCKREANDIWKSLYEFPLIETSKPATFLELQNTASFIRLFGANRHILFTQQSQIKHILSHQTIYADFYKAEIPDSENFSLPDKFQKIRDEYILDFPVSRLIHKYLEKF